MKFMKLSNLKISSHISNNGVWTVVQVHNVKLFIWEERLPVLTATGTRLWHQMYTN